MLRVLLLVCQLIVIGLGITMAANELYGMALIFVALCWNDRPEALRRLEAAACRRLRCALGGHEWRVTGRGLPDSASPGEYSRCARCGRDSREWWEIEDDTLCRLERLHHLVKR